MMYFISYTYMVLKPPQKRGELSMGQFSWMYADSNNKTALKVGGKVYVPCPDETVIYEKYYGGYGIFNDYDIYDLVADWNQNNISSENIRKPLREQWGNTEEDEAWFKLAIKRYNNACQRIIDFTEGKTSKYMEATYGREWKRSIGIDIACYDEENAALKFSIKICKNKPVSYDALPASNSDSNQGWGEE